MLENVRGRPIRMVLLQCCPFLHVSYQNKPFHFISILWLCGPTRARPSSFFWFLDHTQQRTIVGRTPLDEWSAWRRDLYLTTQNTHKRRTSLPPTGFEPTIPAGERPQTHVLDHAATGIWISFITANNAQSYVVEILMAHLKHVSY